MLRRHTPASIRAVPDAFQKIYTHAVEIAAPQRLILLSGQIGVAPDGSTLATFEKQCEQAMSNVEALLAAANMSVPDILRVTYYLTDANDLAALSAIRKARWGSDEPPAVTTLVVAALAKPDLLVEIEVTAGTSLALRRALKEANGSA